jgi:HK97 gp10 family phage protein
MAGFTGVKVEFPEMHELRQKLRQFPSNLAAKHLGAALRKASKPGLTALRSEVRANQKGPTGNLRRAIATKVKTYKKTGNAVALVGFTKAGTGKTAPTAGSVQKGKDRAFHAGFLEFGTKPRYTKKSIASSFKRLGPFKIKPIAKRGKFAGQARVQTTPKLPRAFFKRAPAGQRVFLGRTQPERPIATSFKKAAGSIRSELKAGMATAIEKAAKDLANSFPVKRGGGGDIGPLPF